MLVLLAALQNTRIDSNLSFCFLVLHFIIWWLEIHELDEMQCKVLLNIVNWQLYFTCFLL